MFPCPRSRLRIWSRETGSAVPPRVSPHIFHTQAESDWLMRTHGFLSFLPCSATKACTVNHQRVSLEFILSHKYVPMVFTSHTFNMPASYQLWVWEKRSAQKLVNGDTQKGSTRYRNYLEDYWPGAGGLSAANAIGTQLRDPINYNTIIGTDPKGYMSV